MTEDINEKTEESNEPGSTKIMAPSRLNGTRETDFAAKPGFRSSSNKRTKATKKKRSKK